MKCERADKVQYATEADAKLMVSMTPAMRPRNRNANILRAYCCPFCSYWHLTHKPMRRTNDEHVRESASVA